MLQRYDPWGRPGGGAPNVSCSLYYRLYNIPFKSIYFTSVSIKAMAGQQIQKLSRRL